MTMHVQTGGDEVKDESVSKEFKVTEILLEGDGETCEEKKIEEKPVSTFGTRDFGLAAYAKVKGLKLVRFDGKFFVFESREYTKTMLEIEYANSCCREHDSSVMFMRQMLNVGGGNNHSRD